MSDNGIVGASGVTEIGAPEVTIKVNGVKRTDLVLVSLQDQVSATPGVVELLAPGARFKQRVVVRGDMVDVKVTRARVDGQRMTPHPLFFRGQVVDITTSYDTDSDVTITVHDFRDFLWRDVVRRNYNVISPLFRTPDERLSVRSIVTDVITDFFQRNSVTHPEYAGLTVDFNGLPEHYPSEDIMIMGNKVGQFLNSVAEDYAANVSDWVLVYDPQTNAPILRFINFETEADGVGLFYYATDEHKYITDQPFGVPNAIQIVKTENTGDLANRIIVVGDNIRRQMLVQLLADWPIPENIASYVLQGYYVDDLPEENPRKLSESEIIAIFIGNQDRFLRCEIKDGASSKKQNLHYTPEFDNIGKRFAVAKHLMFDPKKPGGDYPTIIDATEGLRQNYLKPYSAALESGLPVGWDTYCSWRTPEIESELLQVPVPRNENEITQPYPSFLLYRYLSDNLSIARFLTMPDWLAANGNSYWLTASYYTRELNWMMKSDGITVDKAHITLDERLFSADNVFSFLSKFPANAATQAAWAGSAYPNDYLGVFMEITPVCFFDENGQPYGYYVSWKQIIELFDSIFGFPATAAAVDGNHFLRWFCTEPNMWVPDTSSAEQPQPIIHRAGAWEKFWDLYATPNGEGTVALFTDNAGMVPDPPEGFHWVSCELLNGYLFYELPYEIVFNAVAVDSRQVYLDTGKLGTEEVERIELISKPEFKRMELAPDCFYYADYRVDRQNLLIPESDRAAALARILNNSVDRIFVNSAVYPDGWTLRDDSKDKINIGLNPPLIAYGLSANVSGVYHLDEPQTTVVSGEVDQTQSAMGKFAITTSRRTYAKNQNFNIEVAAMALSARIGFAARFNDSDYDPALRITQIKHTFFGGDKNSSNHSSVTVSKV